MEARFNKIYENQGFFDRYNGSVFATAFVVFVFFIIFSYSYIQTRINPIKANWSQERCSPMVIPFAGMINAPTDKSQFEFTYENFNYCIKNIIKESATIAVEPINALVKILTGTISLISTAVDDIRKIISLIRTGVDEISRNIMSRILNFLIPIQQLIINFKATMGKAQAVFTSAMYTGIASLWFLISGLLNIYNFIIVLLIALAATVAVMWIIPFGFGIPGALAGTATAVAVGIPMGMMAWALGEIINITGINQPLQSVPPSPSCFTKDTLIRASDNTLYTINSIPLGTNLGKGGYVTAVLKLDASRETMYKLRNITVSGSHKVRHNKEWIYVRDHPEAVVVSNFRDKYIYCLNTTKKIIPVGDFIFQDWDEMDDNLLKKCGCENEEDVFENLENGFHPNTKLNVKSRGKVEIKNIEIGDILKSGEKIVGLVKIKNNKALIEYNEGFLGTAQFSFLQNLGIVSATNEQTDVLYHILTDKGYLHIKEQKLMDYNWNIDFFNI